MRCVHASSCSTCAARPSRARLCAGPYPGRRRGNAGSRATPSTTKRRRSAVLSPPARGRCYPRQRACRGSGARRGTGARSARRSVYTSLTSPACRATRSEDPGGERLLPVPRGERDQLVQARARRLEVRGRRRRRGRSAPARAPAASQPATSVDRAVPGLDVDVGRRRRREDVVRRRDPDAGDVADERGAARLVQEGDVMRGVAGRVLDPERVEDRLAAREHVQVRLGHRRHLAPQVGQALLAAEEPGRARHELLRRGQVRRAALVHVDRRAGPAPHERAGHARVVEVDVREQDRARDLVARAPRAASPRSTPGPGRPARRRPPSSR